MRFRTHLRAPNTNNDGLHQDHRHHSSPRREQLSRLVSCVVSPSVSSPLNISGTTPLSRAIVKEQWNQALHLATEYPEQARKWFGQKGAGLFGGAAAVEENGSTTTTVVEPVRVLPLHEALVLNRTDLQPQQQQQPNDDDVEDEDYHHRSGSNNNDHDENRDDDSEEPTNSSTSSSSTTSTRSSSYKDCIQALVNAYPEALMQAESSYDRLPLHCACRKRASLEILTCLVQTAPEACLVPDALNRLPLHYALSNGADPAVVRLLLRGPNRAAAESRDLHGFTPLHIAGASGASPTVIRLLLQAHAPAVWVESKSGFTVAQCVAQGHPAGPRRNQIWSLIHQAKLDSPLTTTTTTTAKEEDGPSSPAASLNSSNNNHPHGADQAVLV